MSSSAYLPTIASFWVGPYLSWFEQIGLLSFVRHGHRVILYVKGEVKNVPPGIEVRPSQEIWDPGEIKAFAHEKKVTLHPATLHSDYFRWYLQRETDYIYTDADRFCVNPISISRQDLAEKGCRVGSSFVRFPKNSPTIKLICDFLSQEYPIPPWFSLKERLRLRWLRMMGRGVPASHLPWGSVGGLLRKWAMEQTGEEINSNGKRLAKWILTEKNSDIIFKPSEDMDRVLRGRRHRLHLLMFNWPIIYRVGNLRAFLSHPPEDSWIARQAADLGIVPSDAPVLETRQKNRDYIASLKGIKSL